MLIAMIILSLFTVLKEILVAIFVLVLARIGGILNKAVNIGSFEGIMAKGSKDLHPT